MKPPSIHKLARSCACGNKQACEIGKRVVAMYASSVAAFDPSSNLASHPNKMPFSATLLICDEPSDKPPHGSQGHRILVPSDIARKKLNGLPGMAVNYDPSDLDEHATRHKVGVITKAWMQGPEVKIKGFVWKKDFPEAERDLKRKDLGTSMELADVYVDNENASVWELSDFEFTGATILKRNAAAYTKTNLTAAAKAAVRGGEGDNRMSKEKDKKRKVAAASKDRSGSGDSALMIQALTGSLGPVLTNALTPFVKEIKASTDQMGARLEEFIEEQRGMHLIQAAADVDDASDDEVVLHAGSDESDEDESNDMAAAGDDSDLEAAAQMSDPSASDESASDASDSEDASELEAMEDLESDPPDESTGEVNKDASNRGHKTTVTKPPKQGEHFKGNVAKGRLHSSGKKGNGMKKPFPGLEAAAETIRKVSASNRKLKRTIQAQAEKFGKQNKKLRTKIDSMEASLERFTELESRRSVMPVELTNLAAKAGVNLGELKAQGQQLTIDGIDHMFALVKSQGINIEPEQRIAMKNLLTQEGLLADGEIVRNYGRA